MAGLPHRGPAQIPLRCEWPTIRPCHVNHIHSHIHMYVCMYVCICWWVLIVHACDVQESVESFRPRGRGGEPRASLLGKVVMIDTFTASADMNPYGLPLGTE